MDLPLKARLRLHVPKFVLWAVLETATLVRVLKQVRQFPPLWPLTPSPIVNALILECMCACKATC